jgi:hypothetical protein
MHHWLDHRIPGTQRFGRRTLILLHVGFIWILIGWATLSIPVARFSSPGSTGLLHAMDSPLWGYLWIVGGTLAVIDAPLRKRRHGRDVIGFMGIVTPPLVWLAAFSWSAAAFVVTHGHAGNGRSASGAAAYYAISVFVLIVAGWPDPDDPAIEPKPRQDGGP